MDKHSTTTSNRLDEFIQWDANRHQEAHEYTNTLLLKALKADPELKKQLKHILTAGDGDIDESFLGFVNPYWHLSQMIPKDRIIYDMGCAYAVQAWFFRNHKNYVGVDIMTPTTERLHLPNTIHHLSSIKNWLQNNIISNPHFAICNYVPPWDGGSRKLVRENFQDVYTFYP